MDHYLIKFKTKTQAQAVSHFLNSKYKSIEVEVIESEFKKKKVLFSLFTKKYLRKTIVALYTMLLVVILLFMNFNIWLVPLVVYLSVLTIWFILSWRRYNKRKSIPIKHREALLHVCTKRRLETLQESINKLNPIKVKNV